MVWSAGMRRAAATALLLPLACGLWTPIAAAHEPLLEGVEAGSASYEHDQLAVQHDVVVGWRLLSASRGASGMMS